MDVYAHLRRWIKPQARPILIGLSIGLFFTVVLNTLLFGCVVQLFFLMGYFDDTEWIINPIWKWVYEHLLTYTLQSLSMFVYFIGGYTMAKKVPSKELHYGLVLLILSAVIMELLHYDPASIDPTSIAWRAFLMSQYGLVFMGAWVQVNIKKRTHACRN